MLTVNTETWVLSDKFKLILVCTEVPDRIPDFLFGLVDVYNFSLSDEAMEQFILSRIV
jgi:hypothetical protein